VRKLIKQFEITLDLINDVSNEVFSINQNDLNNIQFDFNLLNDGIPIDLTGSIIRFAIKKPDHFTVIQDAEIVEIGKARVLLTTQSYNEIGNHIGEIYLYENDQTHVFKSKFKYFVAESILNDETIESANEWQSINQALANYIPRDDVEVIVDSKIDEMAANGELSVSTNWTDITNIPTAFEPIDHTHVMADITDLDLSNTDIDLSSKADVIHTHIMADITDLDLSNADIDLSSKADVIHTHTIADITNLQTTLNSKADDSDLTTKANVNHAHAITDITNLQTTLNSKADDSDLLTKANSIHTHAITDVTNLQTTLNSKADESDLLTKANSSDLETKADLNHIHAITDITNLQTALDSKADDLDLTTKADINHIHGIEDVTDLQTILNSKADDTDLTTKADVDHDHLWADITDKPSTFTPAAHGHSMGDVTGLQAALDEIVLDTGYFNIVITSSSNLTSFDTVRQGTFSRVGKNITFAGEFIAAAQYANTFTYAEFNAPIVDSGLVACGGIVSNVNNSGSGGVRQGTNDPNGIRITLMAPAIPNTFLTSFSFMGMYVIA